MFLQGVTLADVVAGRVPGRAVPLDDRAGGWQPSSHGLPRRQRHRTAAPRGSRRHARGAGRHRESSSVHGAGRAARRILEDARESLAARFGVLAQNLVFTSGGTEADALAIHALGAGRRVIAGATEHDAVRAAAPGGVVTAGRSRRSGRSRRAGGMARGGPAGPGLPDAGEQRDGHDPADRRGRRTLSPPRRMAACRCRAGGGAHRCPTAGARRAQHRHLVAQAGRPAGRRRPAAGARGRRDHAADRRRRPGARPPGRHPAPARDRRIRRRGVGRRGRRSAGATARRGRGGGCRGRRRSYAVAERRGWPTPPALPCPAYAPMHR